MPDFRYPFSTKDGMYIPSDIIQPKAFLESVTTTSWSGGIDCTNHKLLFLSVENTSGIAFTVDGVTPPPVVVPGEFTSYPGCIVEAPGLDIVIKVPENFPFIWWITEGNNQTGYIYLISVEEWNTLTTQKGFERR